MPHCYTGPSNSRNCSPWLCCERATIGALAESHFDTAVSVVPIVPLAFVAIEVDVRVHREASKTSSFRRRRHIGWHARHYRRWASQSRRPHQR